MRDGNIMSLENLNYPYIYRNRYASEYQPRSSLNYLNSILGNKVCIKPKRHKVITI